MQSIEAAMSSLAGAVYNKTSGATRSRITILVGGGTAVSMQWILKYGLDKQVIGKGFVWIQLGSTKLVEEMVSSVTAIPKETFRKAYTGFLAFGGPISPDDLGKSMLDTPREFMYHSLLEKYGKFQYGVKWQDKALDPTFPGGGANNLAYDAVWATAIGLAAARQSKDKDAMTKVEVFSRSGGGRGPFKGASGVVSFGDNGERAELGLEFVLANLIPPAGDVNWSLPVFSPVGWTDIARYESSVGLSKISSITPYWPGGDRSWSAPPDQFPPEVPPQPTIVEKIVKTQTIETKYVPIVDPVMVKMSLWLPIPMSEFNAAKERLFIQSISRAAGVNVSQVIIQVKEQAIPRRRQLSQGVSVNVQLAVEDSTVAKAVASKLTADNVNAELARAGLPSAELLSAPEIVLPYKDSTNVAAIVAPTVVVVLALVAVAYVVYRFSTKPVCDEDDVSFEVCQVELRKRLMLTQENGYILSNETPSFFRRWFSSKKLIVIPRRHMEAAVRLWLLEDFDIGAFDALCVMIADSEYNSRIPEDVPWMAGQGVLGDVESSSRPMGKEARLSFLSMRSWQMRNENQELMRTWLLEFAVSVLKDIQKISSKSKHGVLPVLINPMTHVEKSDDVLISHLASIPVKDGQRMRRLSLQKRFEGKIGNRRALETYFREKIMAVHLWQANSNALFKDFKIHVEEMMTILADECFQRFKALKNEPWGKEVCDFCWNPQRGEFSFESAACCDAAVQDMDDVMRQDDENVQAIRWSERDVAEKSYEKRKKLRRVCNKDLGADESVFISQLKRSAFLLDRAFKRKVVETLESSSPAIIISQSQATGHAKTTQDRYTDFKSMVSRERNEDYDFASWLDDGGGDSDDLSSVKSENDTVMGRFSPTSSSDGTAPSTIELQESTGCVAVRVGAFQVEQDRVNVYFAPIKTTHRMEEKLKKYCFPHAWSTWPLSANIRDPIRLSIACDNPGHILQVARLLLSSPAMRVVRVKNKFLQSDEDVKSGLNGLDLSLNALFEDPRSGLKIIGEIQLHDKKIQEVKSRIHKLYKIKRARTPTMIV
jgi:hypothetical protein